MVYQRNDIEVAYGDVLLIIQTLSDLYIYHERKSRFCLLNRRLTIVNAFYGIF